MNLDFANTLEARLQMVAPRFELFIGESGKQVIHRHRCVSESWFFPTAGSPFKLEMHTELTTVNASPWLETGLN
jgi:hypothetical protein